MMRQTSLEVYHNIHDLPKREWEVYLIINSNEPITNKRIAEILSLPINCITGRTRGLYKKGLVQEIDKVIDKNTGNWNTRWGCIL